MFVRFSEIVAREEDQKLGAFLHSTERREGYNNEDEGTLGAMALVQSAEEVRVGVGGAGSASAGHSAARGARGSPAKRSFTE